MKDQYAGDVNDYCKYALLRALAAVQPGRPNVCWMLTAPDGRKDGGKLAYLDAPERLRGFDPPLFDALGALVAAGTRSVRAVEAGPVLSSARFYAPVISDALSDRARYFNDFFATIGHDDLVFFDPDNGLEVASVVKGRRNSSKYLYWDELEHALGGARSVCVYQHFPRVKRGPFVDALLERIAGIRPHHDAFAVTSPWVAYLVCGPDKQVPALRAAAAALVARSGSPLRLVERSQAH
jgi:hypothetical protein